MKLSEKKRKYYREYYSKHKEAYKKSNKKYLSKEGVRKKVSKSWMKWYKQDREKNPDKWRKIWNNANRRRKIKEKGKI